MKTQVSTHNQSKAQEISRKQLVSHWFIVGGKFFYQSQGKARQTLKVTESCSQMKIPLLSTNGMVIIFLFVFLIFFCVRYYCETGDVQGTLSKMPSYKVRETLVLKGLHRHGTDVVS